jgi:hypothetical protein
VLPQSLAALPEPEASPKAIAGEELERMIKVWGAATYKERADLVKGWPSPARLCVRNVIEKECTWAPNRRDNARSLPIVVVHCFTVG